MYPKCPPSTKSKFVLKEWCVFRVKADSTIPHAPLNLLNGRLSTIVVL